jgi:hypothetical protein
LRDSAEFEDETMGQDERPDPGSRGMQRQKPYHIMDPSIRCLATLRLYKLCKSSCSKPGRSDVSNVSWCDPMDTSRLSRAILYADLMLPAPASRMIRRPPTLRIYYHMTLLWDLPSIIGSRHPRGPDEAAVICGATCQTSPLPRGRWTS